jgi:hypothetical protein
VEGERREHLEVVDSKCRPAHQATRPWNSDRSQGDAWTEVSVSDTSEGGTR